MRVKRWEVWRWERLSRVDKAEIDEEGPDSSIPQAHGTGMFSHPGHTQWHLPSHEEFHAPCVHCTSIDHLHIARSLSEPGSLTLSFMTH